MSALLQKLQVAEHVNAWCSKCGITNPSMTFE